MANFRFKVDNQEVLNYSAMTTATLNSPGTLRHLIPTSKGANAKAIAISIDVALVLGFALLTAALAQFSFTLSFTPVPITGQTLGVLLSGAALGFKLGASSQILYLIMGAVGLPFYSEGASGWDVLKGATGGYIVGFIFASALIGFLSEKGNDRHVSSAVGSFLLGSLVIYTFGALWLAHILNIPVFEGPESAMALGVVPFLFGDLLKALAAGLALPGSWKLISFLKKEK
jgi:biotin transport system substrate-specific component